MIDKPIIKFHPMVDRLEHLAQMKEIKVLHADFTTEEVTITFSEPCTSFQDMISRIKFCEMSPRLIVRKANFETGQVTVVIKDTDKTGDLSREEIEALRAGRKIEAIKLYRVRKGVGLADAKNHIEATAEKLYARGVLRRL